MGENSKMLRNNRMPVKSRRSLLMKSSGIALMAMISAPAIAEEAALKDSIDNEGLETIVVTATRRAENLIDVPLAIQAISADKMNSRGIRDIEDLENLVIGLTMQKNGGSFLTPYLRGVGNALPGNYAESSIAIYLDDIPMPRQFSSTSLINIERIEVLKGPQGALYGRNATGGAINIVTREPGDELSGQARVSAGTEDTYEASGYVSIPLSNTLFFSTSYTHREHGGYITNIAPSAPDPELDTSNVDQVFAKLRYEPDEDLKIVIRADYGLQDDLAGMGEIQVDPGTLETTLGFPSGFLTPFLGSVKDRTTSVDQDFFKTVEQYGGSIKIDANFDGFSVTSITSYHKSQQHAAVEVDVTPFPIAGFESIFKGNTTTQEIRIASTDDGPLQWIFGGTYFKDDIDDFLFGIVGGAKNPLFNLDVALDVKAFALFGELSYQVSDSLEVVGSLRYTKEDRDVLFPAQFSTGNIEVVGSRNENKVLPSFALNYTIPDDGGLIYARYARGFKSGGINNLLNPAAVGFIINEFEPETLDSYEIGYKARVAGGKAQITAAAYYYDYKNVQTSRTGGPGVTSFVINAAKAEIYGFELEVAAQVSEGLVMSGGLSYISSEYKDFSFGGLAPLGIQPFVNDGNQLVSTPEWQLRGSFDYETPLTDGWDFMANATVSYRSSFFFDAENSSVLLQEGYANVNTRIGVVSADDKYGIYVYANNLFDKIYATAGQAQAQLGGAFVILAPPRIIGVTLEVNF